MPIINRGLALIVNTSVYSPLPEELIPGQLKPNANLLGFQLIDIQNNGARSRLQEIQFPDDDTVEGRYRYIQALHSRVYIVLAEMKDRFKMKEFSREGNQN